MIKEAATSVYGDVLSEDASFTKLRARHQQKEKPAFSYKNSIEYNTLIQKFGSGARLPELCSVAQILSMMSGSIPEPSRDAKRSFQGLYEWFHYNWELILPFLPFIHLRDENDQIIDGRREFIEKCLKSK